MLSSKLSFISKQLYLGGWNLFRIFKTLSVLYRKSRGGEILKQCLPPTMCHMSGVRCQVLHFCQSGGASRGRVCYQGGPPHLAFLFVLLHRGDLLFMPFIWFLVKLIFLSCFSTFSCPQGGIAMPLFFLLSGYSLALAYGKRMAPDGGKEGGEKGRGGEVEQTKNCSSCWQPAAFFSKGEFPPCFKLIGFYANQDYYCVIIYWISCIR